jgi:biopolymer transport protein TolQ
MEGIYQGVLPVTTPSVPVDTLPVPAIPSAVASVHDDSILSSILGGSVIGQCVLLILLGMSVISWAIMIAKWLEFRRVRRDNEGFFSVFCDASSLQRIDDATIRFEKSPFVRMFRSGYRELLRGAQERTEGAGSDTGAVAAVLRRVEFGETHRLEKGITFLATVASSAPFIGLFGTVWGIMTAFQGLSQVKSTTIQAVAPGISEALVATAVGLAAAIPAAIAYNYFAVVLRQIRQGMHAFGEDFLGMAQRSSNR